MTVKTSRYLLEQTIGAAPTSRETTVSGLLVRLGR